MPVDVAQALESIGAVTRAQAQEVVQAWTTGRLPTPEVISQSDLAVVSELLQTNDRGETDEDDAEVSTPVEDHRMGVLPPEELAGADDELLHRHQLRTAPSMPDAAPSSADDIDNDPAPKDPK